KSMPIKEQLGRLLHALFEYQMNNRLQLTIYLRLLLFPPAVFQKNLKGDLIELAEMEAVLFAEIFERGIQNKEIRQGDCKVYARALICMLDGWFWQMLRYSE